jgi:deoxyribodipyrimidine photolyase-related protein
VPHAKTGQHKESGARLGVVFGDQLNAESSLFARLDKDRDAILMMEVGDEARHVPSHAQRTVLFLSAMRHFEQVLTRAGWRVRYTRLDDEANTHTFEGEIRRAVAALVPVEVLAVEPGEHRVREALAAGAMGTRLTILPDTHFLTPREEFERWARGRTGLTMEYFYREQRRRLGVLTNDDGKPLGGTWNFDSQNRLSFGKAGPKPRPPGTLRFEPDATTRRVIDLVRAHFPDAPGSLDDFGWAVTRAQALRALDDFVSNRLDLFGPYEDAMWTDEPHVYHSLLSPALNLKLISPDECIERACAALERGEARLQSVEAFVRQLVGWREYIRGVYDLEGSGYARRNWLDQHGRLPNLYWTGQTDMNCMKHAVGQVLRTGYGHHIQRLMVTGNFALISGVHPREVSDWYLGMYVDGVDWVTLPNTLGMVMHADGTDSRPPVVGTKPYCASGQYIKRMSNYCTGCRYDPTKRTGENACPFTVFYWDFLNRNRQRFAAHPRMATIMSNLDRFGEAQVTQITISASALRERLGIGPIEKPRTQTPSSKKPAMSRTGRSRQP